MDMICNKKATFGAPGLTTNGAIGRYERGSWHRDSNGATHDGTVAVRIAGKREPGPRGHGVGPRRSCFSGCAENWGDSTGGSGGRGQAFNILESRLEWLFVVSFQLAHLFSGSSLRSCR